MMILLLTFIVAFCSIVYELILGQALSAFLGNTILRYSVTIGLYLFSMGFGAMFAEGRFTKKPVSSFLFIELLLTIVGGFSILLFFGAESLLGEGILFFIFVHLIILVIGFLTGFEIPLLIVLGKKFGKLKENVVLGVDYLGALGGSLFFSFFFYTKVGLFASAFIVALLNGLAGIGMYFFIKERKSKDRKILLTQVFFFLILLGLLFNSKQVSDFFIDIYVR